MWDTRSGMSYRQIRKKSRQSQVEINASVTYNFNHLVKCSPDYEEFDEEPYLDENENDGEMIPLNKRFDYPEKNGNGNDEVDGIDRGLVPAGYFPQPNYYPEVRMIGWRNVAITCILFFHSPHLLIFQASTCTNKRKILRKECWIWRFCQRMQISSDMSWIQMLEIIISTLVCHLSQLA